MPAPRTDIDEHGIATRVALQGIRPTARATGIPVATVQDIAKRHGVKVPDASVRLVSAPVQRTALYSEDRTASVQPAHSVATDALTEKGARGRLASAHIGCTALETIAAGMDADPERGLALLDSAVSATKVMQNANVPYFERQQQASTGINLLVAGNAQVLVQGPVAPD